MQSLQRLKAKFLLPKYEASTQRKSQRSVFESKTSSLKPVSLRRRQSGLIHCNSSKGGEPRARPSYSTPQLHTGLNSGLSRTTAAGHAAQRRPPSADPRNLRDVAVHAAQTEATMQKEEAAVTKRTLKKIIPLAIMFFCILFNYTILRDTKDVLVVTAKGMGAETIPFLKTYVQLPCAIAFIWIYNTLNNRLSPDKVFYASMIPFIIFFISFAFVLYPCQALLHPTGITNHLATIMPSGLAGPLGIIGNWTYALFYSLSELWGSVVVSLLFWGLANQVTTVDEAKRFYPLFGMLANVALVFSGMAVKYFSNIRSTLPPEVDAWAVSLKGLMMLVAIGGAVIAACYWYIYNKVLKDDEISSGMSGTSKKKKKKPKMSMGESLRTLSKMPYIRNLSILVMAYGMTINLVEVTWKSKLKMQFPDPNDYSSFMGDFSSTTGIVTFGMMIAGQYILRKYGWGFGAMITPIVTMATSMVFFGLLLFGDAFAPAIAALGTTPLFMAVMVGAAQNIFSKSAKYSLFDPCKEMAYIPLDDETKIKGKAAIDVVAARLGKSGGSFLQQILIIATGSLSACTPVLVVLVGAVVFAWTQATSSLAVMFNQKSAEREAEQLKELAAQPVCDTGSGSEMVCDEDGCRILSEGGDRYQVKARFISYVDADGSIQSQYIPYTELPEDYFEQLVLEYRQRLSKLEEQVRSNLEATHDPTTDTPKIVENGVKTKNADEQLEKTAGANVEKTAKEVVSAVTGETSTVKQPKEASAKGQAKPTSEDKFEDV